MNQPSEHATTWLVEVPLTVETDLLSATTREGYESVVREIVDMKIQRKEKRWAMFPPTGTSPWREWQQASPHLRQPVWIEQQLWQVAPVYWGTVALMVNVHV